MTDRHDVLHVLGDVVARHVQGALADEQPFDVATYDADLRALGRRNIDIDR